MSRETRPLIVCWALGLGDTRAAIGIVRLPYGIPAEATRVLPACRRYSSIPGGNNVYYAWLRTVSATGVAPLARGTARATSPTPASPRLQAAAVVAH